MNVDLENLESPPFEGTDSGWALNPASQTGEVVVPKTRQYYFGGSLLAS